MVHAMMSTLDIARERRSRQARCGGKGGELGITENGVEVIDGVLQWCQPVEKIAELMLVDGAVVVEVSVIESFNDVKPDRLVARDGRGGGATHAPCHGL